MVRSGRLAFDLKEDLLDSGTDLVNASGLFDAPPQHPEIVRRHLRMDSKSRQDGSSGKHLHKTLADFFQKVLPPVVDAAAPQVDPEPLKVGACIPVDLHDVGGQKVFPCLVSERG